jgi:Lrp/AsnC family leucine-responsive transcriptional regulator
MGLEQLDAVDVKILSLLQKDSSLSVKEIANKVGLSTSPTYERINRLQREGFILKYVAILDREKIGMGLVVYCNITLKEQSKSTLRNFEQAASSLKEVMEVICLSGNYDYLLKVVTTDMRAYHDFVIEKLSTIENIANVQSSFVMEEIKRETAYWLEGA